MLRAVFMSSFLTDSEMKVVDVRRGILPFMPFAFPKKAARYVIELPKYMTLAVREGDEVLMEEVQS